MSKIIIQEAILVEGRYDKSAVSQYVDTTIIEAGGFRINKDEKLVELLRRLAREQGLIVLTDSDAAGFQIRGRLNGLIDPGLVKHAYIPDIYGKESRKSEPSKEGKIGVEGMTGDVLLHALQLAGATFLDRPPAERWTLNVADLYALGLTGKPDSSRLRKALLKHLDLPEHLSVHSMCQVLPAVCTREELHSLLSRTDLKESG